MSELDKRQKDTGDIKGLESKEGERRRLSSNNVGNRSPSLEFNNNAPLGQEDKQRLIEVFSILLEVDRRLHPDTYKPPKANSNESDNLSESIGQKAGLE